MLHIPIERNSVYSTVPHIVTIFISILTGFLGDWMHVNCKISLTNVRKAFAFLCKYRWMCLFFTFMCIPIVIINVSATIPPAIFAILASYGDCSETFVVIMLSLAVSFQGFGVAALVLVPFDLGPNFSGPLNAVVHTCYAIAALFAPIIVGQFTPHVIKFWILLMELFDKPWQIHANVFFHT